MKHCKYHIILIILSQLIFVYCSENKELAPFLDGDAFEYKSNNIRVLYKVHTHDDGTFKITKTEKYRALQDKIEEFFLNPYGIVYKSTLDKYKGNFSPLWIPINTINIGDTFNSGYSAERKTRWKHWEVIVIKNPRVNEERFYEVNTGYFVGLRGNVGRSYNLILNYANADIPTID